MIAKAAQFAVRSCYDSDMAALDLFVYGTLRPGGRHHERHCRGFLAVEPASVVAALEWLPAGYPRLIVRREDVLARGTVDPLADARTQRELGRRELADSTADAPRIGGELLSFDDPETRLPAIDDLEDFRVGGGGLYERVLVLARVGAPPDTRVLPVWTYAALL